MSLQEILREYGGLTVSGTLLVRLLSYDEGTEEYSRPKVGLKSDTPTGVRAKPCSYSIQPALALNRTDVRTGMHLEHGLSFISVVFSQEVNRPGKVNGNKSRRKFGNSLVEKSAVL